MDSYEELFFEYLNKVITQNTVELKAIQTRLSTIIPVTEKHLASLNLPPHTISRLHTDFLKQCKDSHPIETRPELSIAIAKKTPKPGNKRKTATPQPTSHKKPAPSTNLTSSNHEIIPATDQHSKTTPPASVPQPAQPSPFLSLGPPLSTAPT